MTKFHLFGGTEPGRCSSNQQCGCDGPGWMQRQRVAGKQEMELRQSGGYLLDLYDKGKMGRGMR